MIQKNKILTAVLMAGILSVVSLSGSGVTRAESVQTGQTEKKVIGASFASGEASYQETLGTLLEERAKADGAVLVNGEGLIVNETPSDEDLETCKELGKQLIA